MNPFLEIFDRQGIYFHAHLKQSVARDRIKKLKALKKWVFKNQPEIRAALKGDFGKPQHEVDASEIMPVVMEIKDAIAQLHQWMHPKKVSTPISLIGTKSWITYEPKGRSLILAPWNFPFMLTVSPLVSAIAAGCTVILKPSEMSSHTTPLLKKMIKELFSEEEVTCVTGDYKVAGQLTELPFDHIFFTGSPQIGKKVMKAAAENLCSVTLELGGRNPVIVHESAKLSDTARKLVWGKFFNAGQSCMGPNYVLVPEKIEDEFFAAMKKAFEKAFPENHQDMSHAADFSRVINQRHQQRLVAMIESSVEAGAKVFIGGKTEGENYLAPTILRDVKIGNPILEEELFGPIMPVITYKDFDEALSLIHSMEKPLAIYIFARNRKAINRVMKETSSGTMLINETTIAFSHPGLPFGGVNHSGIGKAHGYAGFMAFTNEKPIMKQNTLFPSTLLIHAPYSKWKNKIVNLVMRYF